MARKPSQKRAKITVEAIVEAGFICVATRGMDGTTTRHIAEIAGISVGSLYEYFENKEAVYVAMNQYFTNEVLGMLKRLTPELVQLGLAAAIETMLYEFSDLLKKNDERYLKCIRYAGQFQYDRYANQVESALMDIVMRYVMHNPQYLKVPDIPTVAYIGINGGIFTVIRHLILPNPNISFEQMVNGMTRMINSYVNAELAALKQQETS
jgi:AcrR family transcriptional regulator